MACQVLHYPYHSQLITQPAPEPRDLVWSQIGISNREGYIRVAVVMLAMVILLLFWIRAYTNIFRGDGNQKATNLILDSARFRPGFAAVLRRDQEGLPGAGQTHQEQSEVGPVGAELAALACSDHLQRSSAVLTVM
jgi:hypothetical protein